MMTKKLDTPVIRVMHNKHVTKKGHAKLAFDKWRLRRWRRSVSEVPDKHMKRGA